MNKPDGLPVPLLSVIVPALKVDQELRRCIDSVQLALPNADDYEIILVIPSRQTAQAVVAFPDVRVLSESRPSVYAAMNDGVAASRGRYLYFLGKDDILLPSACDVMAILAARTPAAVFTDVYWGSFGQRPAHTSKWKILFKNVCHQGVIYERDAVIRHGPYIRRFRSRADQLLNIRVLWDTSLRSRIRHLRLPLAWYAATGLSSTVPDREFARVQPAIIRRYLGPVPAWAWYTYKRVQKATRGE